MIIGRVKQNVRKRPLRLDGSHPNENDAPPPETSVMTKVLSRDAGLTEAEAVPSL